MSADLPESVRTFITANVDSVDQLEVLLLLHAFQERRWGIDEVAAELRIPGEAAGRLLRLLCWRTLIVQEDKDIPLFRFVARDRRLRTAVDLLALVCHQRQAAVAALLASGGQERADAAAGGQVSEGDDPG
jgi:hypothetical protein